MARNTDPVCKQCRRENEKLFLKGERCLGDKCAMEKRPYPPGEHGKRMVKKSEYSMQLREKQKAKRIYGILEKQFKKYYALAVRQRGITGRNLLKLLEARLDNVVYRMGFALSRRESRQMVRHKHFLVNGKGVNIPSYRIKAGDEITLSEKGKKVDKIKENAGSQAKVEVSAWLEVDHKKLTGKVARLPSREDIDTSIQENLIVELYSK